MKGWIQESFFWRGIDSVMAAGDSSRTIRAMRFLGICARPAGYWLSRCAEGILRQPAIPVALAGAAWVIGTFLPIGNMRTILVLLAMALFVIGLSGTILNRLGWRERNMLLCIGLLALFGKLTMILLMGETALAQDERNVYHNDALRTLTAWEDGTAAETSPGIFQRMLAVTYLVTGPSLAVGRMWNACLMLFVGLMVAAIGKRLAGEKVGIVAFALTQLTPQATLWTSLLLRESLILFIAMAGVLWTIRIADEREWSVGMLLFGLAWCGLLFTVRHYLGVILGITLATGVVISVARRSRHRQTMLLGAAFLVLLGALAIALQGKFDNPYLHISSAQYFSVTTAHEARMFIAQTGQGMQYEPDAHIGTFAGALRFLPRAYVGILFLPFPAQVTNMQTYAYFALSTLEYLILPLIAIGILYSLQNRWRVAIPLVLYAVLVLTVHGIIEPSVGNLVRHRIQAMVPLMPFAAVALTLLWKRSRQKHGRSGTSHNPRVRNTAVSA